MSITISTIAAEMYEAFESFKRDGSETTIYKLRDGSPDWMTDVVYDAHGDMFPEDWRYEAIMDAVSHIADADVETADDLDSHEFAESAVDVYTHDRLRWLASHLDRVGYVDDAVEQLGHSEQGIVGDIGGGQYLEYSEVFGSVAQALADRLEALEDAETEDADV